jgi:ABC-2 type transport system ATP-binding protein
VLILDEPLNGLDPEGIRWMRGLLRSLAGEGRTVLVSSHLLTEVAQTVDEVIVLAKGRLIAETALADLAGRSSVTRARTTDATRLADVLLAAGIQVRVVDGTTVEARGTDGDTIGLAATGAGLPILELSRHDEDLETLFFEMVNDRQEVAA